MTVAVQTLRPNATILNEAALNGAAPTAHAALADDDDSTYLFGFGAQRVIVGFPAPTVAPGERVARARLRLRAADTDAQGTEIRGDLADAAAELVGAADSAPTVLAATTYTGRWFGYRPQGGAWATADAQALRVTLNFFSGATALGALALALYLDVDVTAHELRPARRGGRR